MENKSVTHCPRCSNSLIATRLSCQECDLELTGNFEGGNFAYLSVDEMDFVMTFLKHHGNFKAVQEEMGMHYPAVKKKMSRVVEKLGVEDKNLKKETESEGVSINFLQVASEDSLVIKKIKEKLNASGGKTTVSLFRGEPCDIWFDANGKGLVSPKIPLENQLTWETFDAAVEVVMQNGGKALKGKARSGAKVGSKDLPLHSVEGYIAHKVHGVQEGKTAFGPGFVIAAILDWAEVCSNERGYLTINPGFEREMNSGGVNMKNLENKFHNDMKNIYFTAKRELNYNPSRFIQLVSSEGGLKAAKQLISKSGGTYGFEILWENRRLDLSVEALVLRPEYEKLFTDEERETCRDRLREYGYEID